MAAFEGQAAIVTGSSGGIGRAIAIHLAGEGASVVVNSRDHDRTQPVVDEIDAAGGEAIGVEADVTDRDAVADLVEATVDRFGGVDVLVNNAGYNVVAPAAEFDPEDWSDVLDVMLTGTFHCAQLAGRHMLESAAGGRIVNVSSIWGSRGLAGRAPYTAAKAGVENLTRTLAVEWGDSGVRVNAVAPGYVRTEMVEAAAEGAGFNMGDVRARTPLGRLGDPEEIARCVAFLAREDTYVTGEMLHADGGWLAYGWGYEG